MLAAGAAGRGGGGVAAPVGLDGGLERLPGAGLALISPLLAAAAAIPAAADLTIVSTVTTVSGQAMTATQYISNTLLYAGLAALFDVMLATAIAYVVYRTGLIGRKWLDYTATAALAV